MASTVEHSTIKEKIQYGINRFMMLHGRKCIISLPYVWLILLFFIPFLIIFKISFSEMIRGIPPYTSLLNWEDGQLIITLSLNNYANILEDSVDIYAYLQSLKIGMLLALVVLFAYQCYRYYQHKKRTPLWQIVFYFLTLSLLFFVLIRFIAWCNLSGSECMALAASALLAISLFFLLFPVLNRIGHYLPSIKIQIVCFILLILILFWGLTFFFYTHNESDSALNTFLDNALFSMGFIQSSIFNIKTDISDSIYINGYLQSLRIAGISTILCVIIAYPLAWAISKCRSSTRNILLLLVVLPSWTSFLIRIYAWSTILRNNGLLNHFLMYLGIINEPLVIMNTDLAVYIGIVYAYLPFVLLPIYNSLMKIDQTLIEAAADLGCRPVKTFFSVVLPLTQSGVIAGAMLVFIPSVGEYVIPELLGGSNTNMIGRVLWEEFFKNRDWPAASAVAFVMLLILIVPIYYFNKQQNNTAAGKR